MSFLGFKFLLVLFLFSITCKCSITPPDTPPDLPNISSTATTTQTAPTKASPTKAPLTKSVSSSLPSTSILPLTTFHGKPIHATHQLTLNYTLNICSHHKYSPKFIQNALVIAFVNAEDIASNYISLDVYNLKIRNTRNNETVHDCSVFITVKASSLSQAKSYESKIVQEKSTFEKYLTQILKSNSLQSSPFSFHIVSLNPPTSSKATSSTTSAIKTSTTKMVVNTTKATTANPTTTKATTTKAPLTTFQGKKIDARFQLNINYSMNFTSFSKYSRGFIRKATIVALVNTAHIAANYIESKVYYLGITKVLNGTAYKYECQVYSQFDATTHDQAMSYEKVLSKGTFKMYLIQILHPIQFYAGQFLMDIDKKTSEEDTTKTVLLFLGASAICAVLALLIIVGWRRFTSSREEAEKESINLEYLLPNSDVPVGTGDIWNNRMHVYEDEDDDEEDEMARHYKVFQQKYTHDRKAGFARKEKKEEQKGGFKEPLMPSENENEKKEMSEGAVHVEKEELSVDVTATTPNAFVRLEEEDDQEMVEEAPQMQSRLSQSMNRKELENLGGTHQDEDFGDDVLQQSMPQSENDSKVHVAIKADDDSLMDERNSGDEERFENKLIVGASKPESEDERL